MRLPRPAHFISVVGNFRKHDIGFRGRRRRFHGIRVEALPDDVETLLAGKAHKSFPARSAGFLRFHQTIREAGAFLLSKNKAQIRSKLSAKRDKEVDILAVNVGADFAGMIPQHGKRRNAFINRRGPLQIHDEDVFEGSRRDVSEILRRCNQDAALGSPG